MVHRSSFPVSTCPMHSVLELIVCHWHGETWPIHTVAVVEQFTSTDESTICSTVFKTTRSRSSTSWQLSSILTLRSVAFCHVAFCPVAFCSVAFCLYPLSAHAIDNILIFVDSNVYTDNVLSTTSCVIININNKLICRAIVRNVEKFAKLLECMWLRERMVKVSNRSVRGVEKWRTTLKWWVRGY